MTNEEFQNRVLQELSSLKTEVSSMKSELSSVKTEVSGMKTELSSLKTEVSGMKTEQSSMKTEQSSMKTELSDMKAQQQENTDLINALIHNVAVANAKLDGLTISTATKESVIRVSKNIDRLGTDMSFLVRKAAEHDDDIRELRQIK